MVSIRKARLGDVKAICNTRKAAADELTARFGNGAWSHFSLANMLKRVIKGNSLYVVEIDSGATFIGVFTLDRSMPNFYDKAWFTTPRETALCSVRSMAIDPAHQRQGHGRGVMQGIEIIAIKNGLKSIRLDAYAGEGGAGEFYQKCGYKCVHKGKFKNVKLEYYEKVLG